MRDVYVVALLGILGLRAPHARSPTPPVLSMSLRALILALSLGRLTPGHDCKGMCDRGSGTDRAVSRRGYIYRLERSPCRTLPPTACDVAARLRLHNGPARGGSSRGRYRANLPGPRRLRATQDQPMRQGAFSRRRHRLITNRVSPRNRPSASQRHALPSHTSVGLVRLATPHQCSHPTLGAAICPDDACGRTSFVCVWLPFYRATPTDPDVNGHVPNPRNMKTSSCLRARARKPAAQPNPCRARLRSQRTAASSVCGSVCASPAAELSSQMCPLHMCGGV